MNQALLILRGVLKRCPRCGANRLFRRWTALVEVCPRCGLRFEREEGYWVGAMTLNIVVTQLVFFAFLVSAILLTWPSVPVWTIIIVGVLLNVTFPIVFYPFSKTIWLGIDLAFFHPIEPHRD